jgi:DNA-binding Xre family transcriptional regulator
MTQEDARRVRPNGLAVRRMRHDRSWSPRDLIDAVARASERSTGISETITPQLLSGIEEQCEAIPYATLCLIAGGLDCDPIDILDSDPVSTTYH